MCWKELSESYPALLKTLRAAISVEEASTAVLTQYERPADQGDAVRKKRASYGQGYFDKYGKASQPAKAEAPAPEPLKLDNVPTSWAKEAVEWATANGLMVGDANGDLMLRSPITREQFCVMLKRYHDTIGKVNKP